MRGRFSSCFFVAFFVDFAGVSLSRARLLPFFEGVLVYWSSRSAAFLFRDVLTDAEIFIPAEIVFGVALAMTSMLRPTDRI